MTYKELVQSALAVLKSNTLTPKKKIEKAIQILETPVDEVVEPPPPPPEPQLPIISGGDLQAELNKYAVGMAVQLQGAFEIGQTLVVKEGMRLVGPAIIKPKSGASVQDGIAPGPNVTLEKLDVSGFSRHGVRAYFGTTILGGRYHHNLKDGVGADLDGKDGNTVVLRNCEIDHNGSTEWLGLGAAGVKMFHTRSFFMDNCNVHDNVGNGVWGDAHCGDFTVTGSVVTNNLRKGVFYEKCGESDGSFLNRTWAIYTGKLVVRGNTIKDNDTEGVPNANAGVAIIASKNAVVEDNVFGGTQERAIIVRNDPNRVADDKHGWIVENVVLRNNTLNGTEIIGCNVTGVVCEGNV